MGHGAGRCVVGVQGTAARRRRAKVVSKCGELGLVEWLQHHREGLEGKLSEQPRQHGGVDACVLLDGEGKVLLGGKPRAIQKEEIDQVAGLGA